MLPGSSALWRRALVRLGGRVVPSTFLLLDELVFQVFLHNLSGAAFSGRCADRAAARTHSPCSSWRLPGPAASCSWHLRIVARIAPQIVQNLGAVAFALAGCRLGAPLLVLVLPNLLLLLFVLLLLQVAPSESEQPIPCHQGAPQRFTLRFGAALAPAAVPFASLSRIGRRRSVQRGSF